MTRPAVVQSLAVAALALLLGVPPLPAATYEVGAVPGPPESLGPEVEVPGLLAPVRVRRDAHDVPHIFARNDRDALFALGRAHARDRFFQMDLLRRTFSGTLAELVGPAALESDVQLRTLGLRRAAATSLPAASEATRAWLNAYARGVNSWLRDPASPLPPEYGALELSRAGIPAWTPVDSLVIAKGLAFGLSFDLGDIDLTVALDAFQEAGEDGGFDGAALFSQDLYRSAPFDPAVSIPASCRVPCRPPPVSARRPGAPARSPTCRRAPWTSPGATASGPPRCPCCAAPSSTARAPVAATGGWRAATSRRPAARCSPTIPTSRSTRRRSSTRPSCGSRAASGRR